MGGSSVENDYATALADLLDGPLSPPALEAVLGDWQAALEPAANSEE